MKIGSRKKIIIPENSDAFTFNLWTFISPTNINNELFSSFVLNLYNMCSFMLDFHCSTQHMLCCSVIDTDWIIIKDITITFTKIALVTVMCFCLKTLNRHVIMKG